MTEDEFVDVLTNGIPRPIFNREYIEYYRNNPWQIPNDQVRLYMRHFETEFEIEHAKYVQQQPLIP